VRDILRIAQDTGIADSLLIDDWPDLKRFAQAVADLAVLREREACARLAISLGNWELADKIRDRGME
jgi:hypothetical protein